jgi:hypothetical protein
MPRAFGDDRLGEAKDGVVTIEARADKGWTARSERTPLCVEHPGTAVRWDEDFWEVLVVERSDDVVRYTLAPWDERHVFRVVSEYSEAAEEERRRVRGELQTMRRKRRLSLGLALLAGHLPGPVQLRMEREFGAPAARLTILSALPLFFLGAFCAVWLVISTFVGGFGVATGDKNLLRALPDSFGFLIAGAVIGAESAIRIVVASLQGRPAGSAIGTVVYEVWRRLRRAPVPGESTVALAPDLDARRLEDDYRMAEPLLALLRPVEQVELAERFGFDPIRWGRRTSILLLLFFGLVVYRALARRDMLVLVAAGGLVVEQVARLVRLSRGEAAGSVLGLLVRPFTRGLLAARR